MRELIPDQLEIHTPALGARRGPGGYAVYSTTVHADFPVDFRSAAEGNPALNLDVEREQFLDSNAREYHLLNFWRPVLPMQQPVVNRPLCFCDPSTVREEDLITEQMDGQLPGGQRYVSLKYNPSQQWCFYPAMTTEEVLVFRQCHYVKGHEQRGAVPVFHTSFVHPDADRRAEPRCSFEYRVSVLT